MDGRMALVAALRRLAGLIVSAVEAQDQNFAEYLPSACCWQECGHGSIEDCLMAAALAETTPTPMAVEAAEED